MLLFAGWLALGVLLLAASAQGARAIEPPPSGNGVVSFNWGPEQTETFNYTGDVQEFLVPAAVFSIKVAVIGAAGGNAGSAEGGVGARVIETIPVAPGELLYVYVGGRGGDAEFSYANCALSSTSTAAGGFNGGGPGGVGESGASSGAGGGGMSSVVQTSTKVLMAAGGGGGAGGSGSVSCMSVANGGAGGTGSVNGEDGGQQYPVYVVKETSHFGGHGGESATGMYGSSGGSSGESSVENVGGGLGESGHGGAGGFGRYEARDSATRLSGGAGGGGGGGAGGGYKPMEAGSGLGGGGGGGVALSCAGGAFCFTGTAEQPDAGGGGGGGGGASYPPTQAQQISGKIVTTFGDGLAGATVQLSGSEDQSATTNQNGEYGFTVEPGTYTVAPVPDAVPAGNDEYTPTACTGVSSAGACSKIVVTEGKGAIADFTAGFNLSGQVLGIEGKGAPGATVLLQDVEQGKMQTATVETDAEGHFSERLAPGDVTATVKALAGVEFFPHSGDDCTPSNTSCEVNLDHDRSVEFAACVLPNPNGEPLPASIPAEIPGAKTIGALEAVGCWAADQGSPNYTSVKPVRLDGIDVVPSQGVHLKLSPFGIGATVTSDGPVSVKVGGVASFTADPLSLSFPGLGGSGVQIGDIGSGTGAFGKSMNILGFPVNLGSGSPLGNNGGAALVPWSFSPGMTTITLAAQIAPKAKAPPALFSLPSDGGARWNYAQGRYENYIGEPVNSLGLQGSLELTNRFGLVLAGCVSLANDYEPWGPEGAAFEQVQFCYDQGKKQWNFTGLFGLPGPLRRLANNFALSATIQPADTIAVTGPFQLGGYDLLSAEVQLRGVGAGGLQIGRGIYLQRMGGGIQWDPTKTPPTEASDITAGVSFGPSVPLGAEEPQLASLDGQLKWTYHAEPTVWKFSGQLSLLHETPVELPLGLGSVTAYQSNVPCPDPIGSVSCPTIQRVDWSEQGSLSPPSLIQLNGLLTGFFAWEPSTSATPGAAVFQGEGMLTAAFAQGRPLKVETLLHNTVFALCFPGGVGFDWEYVTGILTPGCNIGTLRTPPPPPPTVHKAGHASATIAATALAFGMPAGLNATLLAVRGTSAAPQIELDGPGVSVRSPADARPLRHPPVMLVTDTKSRTTYVIVNHPRGGRWNVRALPGSSPITSVRQANPLPPARLDAKARPHGCQESVTYDAHAPAGETITLYAEDGSQRISLGSTRRSRTTLRFALDQTATKRGQIIAVTTHGTRPISEKTIADFLDAGANGSEIPTDLTLTGTRLRWHASCAAASYTITVAHAGKTTTITSNKPAVKLAATRGRSEITITAQNAKGITLGAAHKIFS